MWNDRGFLEQVTKSSSGFLSRLILAWMLLGSCAHAHPQVVMGSDQIPERANVSVAASPAPSFLPSPPPSDGCHKTCGGGYAPTPPGSPCGCVIPIKVGLVLGVNLDTLFHLMIELAKEIADGSFLLQIQVRIIGANAVTDDPTKTVVTTYLVPLGFAFDNTTAELVSQRFLTKQVYIDESLFGNYTVLYVTYPGLPSRNPEAASPGRGEPPAGVTWGGDRNPTLNNDSGKKITSGIVVVISVSCGFGLIVILGAVSLVLVRWSCKGKDSNLWIDPSPNSTNFKPSCDISMASTLLASSTPMSFISTIAAYAGFVRTFTFIELERATQKFRPENVVGEGGFGRVYQGDLDNGCKVAVKVLTGPGREFVAEVEMLSRLHHRNLVKLIGVCTEEHTKCLVYELVSNGSLELHLHGNLGSPLDWETRMKIALGAGRGLAYLHEDSNPRVIHRDFKASNILLEDDFTPKISDFGLAKEATEGGNSHISTRVMGTFGYVAPEYAMTGHLLVKSDVYSYGVVLLELLTGKKPVDMSQPPGQENLVSWARPYLINRDIMSWCIDPALRDNYPLEDMEKVAKVAYMCVHPEVSQRPFMGEVVQALKLVYNDSETREGNSTVHGSQAVSPHSESNIYRSMPSEPWGGRSPYVSDHIVLTNIDYEIGL